jgi:hypothetical protein
MCMVTSKRIYERITVLGGTRAVVLLEQDFVTFY